MEKEPQNNSGENWHVAFCTKIIALRVFSLAPILIPGTVQRPGYWQIMYKQQQQAILQILPPAHQQSVFKCRLWQSQFHPWTRPTWQAPQNSHQVAAMAKQ